MTAARLCDLAEARRWVAAQHAFAVRCLPLGEALGAVVASDVVASVALPGADNSAMDGFAVRASDCAAPVTLRVLERVLAGQVPSYALGQGQATRIMTGAPLPAGADSVVPLEEVRAEEGLVHVGVPVSAGCHVRRRGEELAPGDVAVPGGTRLGPIELGVLAALGVSEVPGRRRPRVGVLATGDELVGPASAIGAGRVRDSNRPMLLALASEHGFEPIDLGSVRDGAGQLHGALQRASDDCDAVITTGGVSVGDRDIVRQHLGAVSSTMRLFQLAVKPGRPFAFGVLRSGGIPCFGLAGNPHAALVSFETMAAPVLRAWRDGTECADGAVAVRAGEAFTHRSDGKVHFVGVQVRADAGGQLVARRPPGAPTHLFALSGVNGLAALADATEAGAVMRVLPIGGSWRDLDTGRAEPGPRTRGEAEDGV